MSPRTLRYLGGPALLVAAMTGPLRAAEPSPTAERIRSAAAEYDEGRRAFVSHEFADAAVHFENAFHDAARVESLRNAIRARLAAKHYARAATLAAFAHERYPDDAQTSAVAKQTLAESAGKLHEVIVYCTPECGVVSDGRAISLADSAKVTFYLDPGPHDVVVSWTGGRTRALRIDAKPGEHDAFPMQAPPPQPAASSPPPTPTRDVVAEFGTASPRTKPLSPAFFFVGLGLTGLGIGATIWSGLDAIGNPGADAVRRDCVGQGPSCPEYQQGRNAQLRTNVILGVTGGVALVTVVVGALFTHWGQPAAQATDSRRAASRGIYVSPGAALDARGVLRGATLDLGAPF